jgi:hypothetical protein
MKIHHAAAVAALLSLHVPAHAQARDSAAERSVTVSPPSAAAMQLAKAIASPRLFPWISRTTPDEMRKRLKDDLLWTHLPTRGFGCDRNDPRCQAAAEAIASKHAAEYAAAMNDAVDRGHAMILDAKMSQAQIRATLAFIRTDAGRAFVATFRSDPATDRALLMRVMAAVKLPAAPFDEFYEATKDLPRGMIFVPPPPKPPGVKR